MLQKYINAINNSNLYIRYTLIVSGSKSIDVLNYCYKYKYIDDVIIFCNNTNYYNQLKSYPKINLVTNSFATIIYHLKNKSYTNKELDMDNQIPFTPLITFYEYKNCYFAIHRMLSRFFKENWSNPYLTGDDVNSVVMFLQRSKFDNNMKIKIVAIMKNLLYSKNFAFDCIRYYTGEDLCYIFNKTLRDIGKNFDGMSHFVGPFDYALYKYLYDHPNKGIYRNVTLYRDVKMNIFDLYLYYLSYGDVICLPSFTSTTLLKDLNFESTSNSQKVNKTSTQSSFPVKMIFTYKYNYGNVSPGILINKESEFSSEEEVILFPFTFVRIAGIVNRNNVIQINLDIIKKDKIIEFALKRGCKFDLDNKNNKLIIN